MLNATANGQAKLRDEHSPLNSKPINTNHSTTSTAPHNAVNSGVMLTHSILMEALGDLRVINAMNRDELIQSQEKMRIRMEWMRLADRVENISLTMFILGCAVSVLLFFKHDWY